MNSEAEAHAEAFFEETNRQAFFAAMREVDRLPSVEAQLFKWFEIDSRYGIRSPFDYSGTNRFLEGNGFRLYVRGMRFGYGTRELWVLALARVELAEPLRSRGWFGVFLDLMWHLMPHDALLAEQVINPRLRLYFSRRSEFVQLGDSFLRLSARGTDHCPLRASLAGRSLASESRKPLA